MLAEKDGGIKMGILLRLLGLQLHPTKFFFNGSARLELLGILVDTEGQQLLMPPKKPRDLARASVRLLRHVIAASSASRRSSVFTGLANTASPAVVDCRLRLKELFNCLAPHVERAQSPQRREPKASGAKGISPRDKRFPIQCLKSDARLSHAAMSDLQC